MTVPASVYSQLSVMFRKLIFLPRSSLVPPNNRLTLDLEGHCLVVVRC